MTKDNVIQLTPELFKDFENKKLFDEVKDLDIELMDVRYGDTILGTLTTEESKLFVAIERLKDEIEQFNFDKETESLSKYAEKRKESGHRKDTSENIGVFGPIRTLGINFTDEEAEILLEMETRLQYLDSYFWYTLRTRINSFSSRIGIRSGFKVVRNGWKHKK